MTIIIYFNQLKKAKYEAKIVKKIYVINLLFSYYKNKYIIAHFYSPNLYSKTFFIIF